MTSTPRHGRRPAALIALVLIAALAALHATPSPAASGPVAVAAANCNVQIQKSGKLVNVYKRVYKYKFKRVKGSKSFKRVIVRVKVPLRATCGTNCVLQVKRKGKLQPVYVIKRITVTLKRGSRLVKKKVRRKSYKFGACPEKKSSASLGAPVSVRVLGGSVATLDFGAFQRDASLTGTLKGFVPGGIQLGKDQQVNFSSGTLNIAQTPVFIDDACNGDVSAAIRTGKPTTVGLNATKASTATLTAGGTVTSIVYTRIKLPLELRNDDDGCQKPYISTGYTLIDKTFFLKGKLGAGGLAKIELTSVPDELDVSACLAPGRPTNPCNGFAIPLPILVSTHLFVAIDLKG
jgi:hypothetical protein